MLPTGLADRPTSEASMSPRAQPSEHSRAFTGAHVRGERESIRLQPISRFQGIGPGCRLLSFYILSYGRLPGGIPRAGVTRGGRWGALNAGQAWILYDGELDGLSNRARCGQHSLNCLFQYPIAKVI